MLKLVDADEKYLSEYKEAYRLSLKKMAEGAISAHDLMFVNPDEVDVIQKYRDARNPNKLKRGRVLEYSYFLINEKERFVGRISIRLNLTPQLLQFGGQIGYGIHPKYWKQGYGSEGLKLALHKAKELIQENKVLVTCDADNIGSRRIIEKNGGVLENTVTNAEADGTPFLTRRYWIKIR